MHKLHATYGAYSTTRTACLSGTFVQRKGQKRHAVHLPTTNRVPHSIRSAARSNQAQFAIGGCAALRCVAPAQCCRKKFIGLDLSAKLSPGPQRPAHEHTTGATRTSYARCAIVARACRCGGRESFAGRSNPIDFLQQHNCLSSIGRRTLTTMHTSSAS